MRALSSKRRGPPKLAVVSPSSPEGHRVGRLIQLDPAGPLVDFPGNPSGPVLARTTLSMDPKKWREAVGREVLLVFDGSRADRPIVTGVLNPFDEVAPPPLEVSTDGRRISLEAADEIVLRCGKASLTLRRNGRVVIRGAYVESESTGVNRVKGGSVKLN